MLKKYLIISALTLLVSGCASGPKVYSATDTSEFKKSPRKAVQSISAGGNISVSVSEGNAFGAKTDGFQTRLFNMASAYQTAKLPLNIVVQLDDSPPARRVKAEGMNIYVYAKPQLVYTRKFNKTGKSQKKTETANFPKHGNCDGYYMILGPQNNYRITVNYDQKFKFREKSEGVDFGMWGRHGSSDWKVTNVEGKQTKAIARTYAFYAKDIYGRYEDPCFYGPHRVAWRKARS